MDELELKFKYPLGMDITFMNTSRTGHMSGTVSNAPIATDDGNPYVPVYVGRLDQIIYVNENNIVEP
jgi:hypothetical protein